MPLNSTLLPLVLYHKAKQLLWDPREIDLSQDVRDPSEFIAYAGEQFDHRMNVLERAILLPPDKKK